MSTLLKRGCKVLEIGLGMCSVLDNVFRAHY